jgi:hypothetical protein
MYGAKKIETIKLSQTFALENLSIIDQRKIFE